MSEHQVALWDESLGRGCTDARFAAGLLLSLKQEGGQGQGCQVMFPTGRRNPHSVMASATTLPLQLCLREEVTCVRTHSCPAGAPATPPLPSRQLCP